MTGSGPDGIISGMHDKDEARRPSAHAGASPNDSLIQALSLEYQTLKDEIIARTSGRFQFVGLTTTAAAIFATGIGAAKLPVLASGILAGAVFLFGLGAFWLLGVQIVGLSSRVAEIEARINDLLPVPPDGKRVLSWELERQRRSLGARFVLADARRRHRV